MIRILETFDHEQADRPGLSDEEAEADLRRLLGIAPMGRQVWPRTAGEWACGDATGADRAGLPPAICHR
jgi:hypothetical protein